MNAIQYAINFIQRGRIPKEILQEVFINRPLQMGELDAGCGSNISMEHRIREEIIEGRMMPDLNIVGGSTTYIPLDYPVRAEYVDPYTTIYYIPDSHTQNRPIVQINSIHFGILGYQSGGFSSQYNQSAMSGEIRKVLDSARRVPVAQTSYLALINHNTVMVRFLFMPSATAYLSCRLGNDDELLNIRPQAFPMFARLMEQAVKAHCYNELNIQMGEAQLSGGQQLGVFSDVVRNWEGANDVYDELLIPMQKILRNFNDPEGRRRHLRTVTGSQ